MRLAAVLFDVDGTLIESEEIHRQAFNAAFQEFGVSWHWDRALYKELLAIGGGAERLRHYVARAEPDLQTRADFSNFIDGLHKAKNFAYAELLATKSVALRPGVERLVQTCLEEGLRLAITTSTTRENVETIFRHVAGGRIKDAFEVIGDGDRVRAKKPSPDIYVWTLNELGLSPQACLAFEDTPRGVQASVKAGIAAVATVTSYTIDEAFPGAVAVLSDMGEHERPFRVISGHAHGRHYVDIDLLRLWHRGAHPQLLVT
ncbi:MAG: HAD-IA family hydrolase [Alphaproteobacteria bacterium GM202ARS2]|nr:HAD-IA family hydrolase [Alphaproteobacteria bacterium GM202ARS2]